MVTTRALWEPPAIDLVSNNKTKAQALNSLLFLSGLLGMGTYWDTPTFCQVPDLGRRKGEVILPSVTSSLSEFLGTQTSTRQSAHMHLVCNTCYPSNEQLLLQLIYICF